MLPIGELKANLPSSRRFAETKQPSVFFSRVIDAIRICWPRKTSAHVAHITGVSERAVQFWLAGETRMTLEHVAALLRTDDGYSILEAIMGDAKPAWWLNAKLAAGIRENQKAIRKVQQHTDELRALRDQLNLFDQ